MRLAPLEPPYDPDLARTLQRLMGGVAAEPLALFRTVAHNPVLLDKLRSTGTYLLNFGTVDPAERELVILRTCARCGSTYEWGVHAALFAEAVGLTDAQVNATAVGSARESAWSARQAILVRLVDELHESSTVSDDLWSDLAAGWETGQIVELIALVGQYHLVSFWTNALGVESEQWARPFPHVREVANQKS